MSEVRILNASLEEDPSTGEIIIRGVLDKDTMKYIRLDWYQREQAFSKSHIEAIVSAFFSGNGRVPEDIIIGMRGQRCDLKGDTYVLHDKCYCINGGQRLFAAGMALQSRPDLEIRLGVKVFTDTNEDKENKMFTTLGMGAKRISSSILVRNQRKLSEGAALLVAMNNEHGFALKDRIAWDQVKRRHQLLTGLTFTKIVARLHAHKGVTKSSRGLELVVAFDRLIEVLGEEVVKQNIIRFFDAIDKCWTLRQIADTRETHPQLNGSFLQTIALLLSGYSEFWEGKDRNEFHFEDKYVRLMRGFKLSDYVHSQRKFPKEALYEVLRKRLKLKPIFTPETKPAEASSTPASTGIPFMITRDMKKRLRECGLTDAAISLLTPQSAHDILNGRMS